MRTLWLASPGVWIDRYTRAHGALAAGGNDKLCLVSPEKAGTQKRQRLELLPRPEVDIWMFRSRRRVEIGWLWKLECMCICVCVLPGNDVGEARRRDATSDNGKRFGKIFGDVRRSTQNAWKAEGIGRRGWR